MIRPATKEAYKLLHTGALALAQIEANGICIDTDYLDRMLLETKHKIQQLTEQLHTSDVYRVWKKTFRDKTNLDSSQQLATVLFDKLRFESAEHTATNRPSTNESNLKRVDHPFVQDYLQLKKFKKLRGTYLKGVRREVVDGFLHPVFNLHLIRSYRSSSDSPNFQNIPIRNKEIAQYIRRAFIPRPGNYLLEIDYGQIEVRGSACYHQDPTMLKYIASGYDFHQEFAMKCFHLTMGEVTKPVRQVAKNGFVFPCFYGSYHGNIAPSLWETIEREGLQTADGKSLYTHLRSKRIKNLEVFTNHIKQVEDYLWNNSFPKYRDWKTRFFADYERTGYFQMLTGFVVSGYLQRKEVCNYPIQGSSFHCLLWSLIQLNKWLRQHKFKTLIVGQIHDSIILDVFPPELNDVLAAAKQIMTEDIRKVWQWIITPLEVEAEMSATNWFEKQKVDI